jgi:hypothetical protein
MPELAGDGGAWRAVSRIVGDADATADAAADGGMEM